MPIRFASEAWPRPGLAEPRSASIAGCGNTGPLSATEQKGKECHNQDKQAQGASFGGSFLVPEIDMIFGDGVGTSLVCAVTMALLTNRLDLCIQGFFGAGKSKSMAVLILALLELDATDSLEILFICKENSGSSCSHNQLALV